MKIEVNYTVLVLALTQLCTSISYGQEELFFRNWEAPEVQQYIDEGIEKYRKGDAIIRITDASGQPIAGVKLDVHQIKHEFLFGSNLFVLGQLETDALNQKYEQRFKNLFNFATLPFYY